MRKKWIKYVKEKLLKKNKIDTEEQKLNLLMADVYFEESRVHFPSNLFKSKELVGKALSLSPENKEYLSLYNELDRLISISPSNPNVLSHYYKDFINFLESKMDARLVTSDETSFSVVCNPTAPENPLTDFDHRKVIIFVVEDKDDTSTLSAVETITLNGDKVLERTIMKIPVRRGITAEEFVSLYQKRNQ